MKEIKLKNGGITLVSDCDYDNLVLFDWRSSNERGYQYAVSSSGLKMHRLIMNATKSTEIIDHINKDTLDNTRENLRVCTRGENRMNSKVHSNTTTGYKGVFFNEKSKRYETYITANGKRHKGKTFVTAYEAMLHYNEMAKNLHGEFAGLNTPTFEDQFKSYLRGETSVCPER